MSANNLTPPPREPQDDGQATTGYAPAGADHTEALPPTPSHPGPAGPDLGGDTTEPFPPPGAYSDTEALTGGRPPEATSPTEATGAYTPGGTPAQGPAGPTAAPPVRADRYALKRFHAKGGMGEVWLAEDCDVGRAVALKRMRRQGTPEEQERFLREARITGQLEHPGIVPVHELGSDEHGQPVYVMKFVHGRTLTDVIKEYHAGQAGAVPREVQLLRLLEGFVSLCQTVAYAHSRGVLHRDLKPDNVMLGPYGETLVLDWGLAKLMGQADGGGGVSLPLSASGESLESLAGTVRGTPGYMAPEMAGGQVEAIDQLSDVYLLGATLYHILTGRQPRRGKPIAVLLQEAMTVAPAPPRDFDATLPRPLEAICQKAMAWAKADRYPGADALADDMQRYLAGEPVVAYPEGFKERAWRWVRKHRRGLTRAAAALLILGVGLGVSLYVRGVLKEKADAERRGDEEAAQRQRETEAREQFAKFGRLADESRFYLASVNPATEQTPYYDPVKGLSAGDEALGVADRLADLPLSDGERADVKDQLYDLLLLMAQARAQEVSGEAVRDGLDLLARAEALRTPSAGLHRLRAARYRLLHDDRADEEAKRAEAGDAPPAAIDHFLRGEHDRAVALRRPSAPQDLLTWRPKPDFLTKALGEYREALRLRPNDFWAHYHVGLCEMSLGRWAEAAEAYGACLALRPDSVWAYTARASALIGAGRYEEAERDLTRALELDRDLMPARLARGLAAMYQNKPAKEKDALDDFAAVLSAPPDKRLIEAAYYRGVLHRRRGEPDEALADFDRVAAEDPRHPRVYRQRAAIHFLKGERAKGLDDVNALLAAGRPLDLKSAEACGARGRLLGLIADDLAAEPRAAVRTLAVEEFRKASQAGARSADFLGEFGLALDKVGDYKEAIDKYTEALKLKPNDVTTLTRRGWARVNTGDPAQVALAEADFAAAVGNDPFHAEAHTGLGYILAEQNAEERALREAHLATLYGAADYGVLHNAACIYAALARRNRDRKEYEDLAIDTLRRSLDIWERIGRIDPSELVQIDNETAFSDHLRKRDEFVELLKGRKQ